MYISASSLLFFLNGVVLIQNSLSIYQCPFDDTIARERTCGETQLGGRFEPVAFGTKLLLHYQIGMNFYFIFSKRN
jgi:hypothetical protein